MSTVKLSNRYPIRRILVVRNVFGKLLIFIILAALLVRLFDWRRILGDELVTEVGDLIVSSLMMIVFGVLIVIDATREFLLIRRFEVSANESTITIRRGVLSTHEVTLPFDRITDIYVNQDVLDRIFALYNLNLSTPTSTSRYEARIEGLSKDDCYALRQTVLDALRRSPRADAGGLPG